MVDNFTDEKKVVIYETRNRVTDFDEKTKPLSIYFLNKLIAKENALVCSILFETKEEESLLEKNTFSFDTIETDDTFMKYEAFIGSNDVKFPFARGKKMLYALPKICALQRRIGENRRST